MLLVTNKTKSTVLLLHEGEYPTVMELYNSFQYLVEKYDISVIKQYAVRVKPQDLIDIDVLICVRGHSPIVYGILELASHNDINIFYYLDDDLMHVPSNVLWYSGRKKWLVRCLQLCDGLITCNELIANDYRPFLKIPRTIILHTPVDPDTIQTLNHHCNNKIVKIVFAASEGHKQDFNTYIKPILPRLFDRFPDKIQLYFIGVHPELNNLSSLKNVYYVSTMPMSDYIKFMSQHKFDIGIGMLKSGDFSAHKYFNKFIEYTRYGICGVYSNCMPFQMVVKNKINGLYAENTPDSWLESLSYAIENPAVCVQCVANAQRYLYMHHSSEYIFSNLLKDIPELSTHRNKNHDIYGDILIYRLQYIIFRIREIVNLTFQSLILDGVIITYAKIQRKLLNRCM